MSKPKRPKTDDTSADDTPATNKVFRMREMTKYMSSFNEYDDEIFVDIRILSDHNFPQRVGHVKTLLGMMAPTTTQLDFYISGRNDNLIKRFDFVYFFPFMSPSSPPSHKISWMEDSDEFIISKKIGPRMKFESENEYMKFGSEVKAIPGPGGNPQDIPKDFKIRKTTVDLSLHYTGFIIQGAKARVPHFTAIDYVLKRIGDGDGNGHQIFLDNGRTFNLVDKLPLLKDIKITKTRVDGVARYYVSRLKLKYVAKPVRSHLTKDIGPVTHLKL